MSWFAKNYEKAALGTAAAASLGLAYFGWAKVGSVDEDFSSSLRGAGNSNPAIEGAGAVSKALASLKLERSLAPGDDNGRSVDLFTGIPLFVKRDAPEQAIDLLKDEPVHPPIENVWWLENRIDPGFADSPQRDPDNDGFSNLEEFTAKTDPNDAKSHPPLIHKLQYVKDETLTWVVRPGFDDGNGAFSFTYQDSERRTNRTGSAEPVGPDGLMFSEEPMKNRLKVIGSEVRNVVNPRTGAELPTTFVQLEDQRPNKKGTRYEVPAAFPPQRANEHAQYDRTAIFTLEAIGQEGTEFKVEENTAFALPADAPEKDYLLKAVTPESVTVEFTDADGSRRTAEIPNGSMPDMNR